MQQGKEAGKDGFLGAKNKFQNSAPQDSKHGLAGVSRLYSTVGLLL